MHSNSLITRFRVRQLAAILGCLTVVTAASAAELRYVWPEQGTFFYKVKIEADRDIYTEIYSGTPVLNVKEAAGGNGKVSFNGFLTKIEKAKKGVRLFPRGPRFRSSLSGLSPRGAETFEIDTKGKILERRGDSQLPYMLGNLSELIIEPLPAKNEKTWKFEETTKIGVTNSRFPFPRPSILRNRDTTVINATERADYSIKSDENDKVVVEKKYTLTTDVKVNDKPKLELTGTGTFTLDPKRGVISEINYKMKFAAREAAEETEVPLTITVTLLSEEEQKKLIEQRKAAAVRAAQPIAEADYPAILEDLKSDNAAKFLGAANKLASKSPASPSPEIAKQLASMLGDEKDGTRFTAARALQRWATDDVVPQLIAALQDKNPSIRGSVMNALANLKAEKGIEPIAELLPEGLSRIQASKALKAYGSAAETAVAKQLKADGWVVRLEACRILKEIGTQKSLKALNDVAGSDSNILVKNTAKDAMKAIEKRTGEVI